MPFLGSRTSKFDSVFSRFSSLRLVVFFISDFSIDPTKFRDFGSILVGFGIKFHKNATVKRNSLGSFGRFG